MGQEENAGGAGGGMDVHKKVKGTYHTCHATADEADLSLNQMEVILETVSLSPGVASPPAKHRDLP